VSEPESLDGQMTRAIGNMRRLAGEVEQIDRKDWTRAQWLTEAETIMDDIDGSVFSLLNGHIVALFEEIHDLRNQRVAQRALRTADLRTILRATPVVGAAENWVLTDGSIEAREILEKTVLEYIAIYEADAKKVGEKND
jgi:predicted RNA-binding Zn ribbon-like protein